MKIGLDYTSIKSDHRGFYYILVLYSLANFQILRTYYDSNQNTGANYRLL